MGIGTKFYGKPFFLRICIHSLDTNAFDKLKILKVELVLIMRITMIVIEITTKKVTNLKN